MTREPPNPCGFEGGQRNAGGNRKTRLARIAKKLKPKLAILKGVK